MSYRHPGHAFLRRFGAIGREEDIYQYVDFLRRESGLSDEPPIDLSIVFNHFGIPTPIRAPLDEQQGILVDSGTGVILIKEDDSIVRQRFTEGHELMELLFDAIADQRDRSLLPDWSESHKERLCDQGAADLLMPRSSFIPRLYQMGISIHTARSLSNLYQTSLIATLVQMIQQGTGNFALVVWRPALKPTEMKTPTPKATEKLRIWWRIQTVDWTGGYIPKDKSISESSIVWTTHRFGYPNAGRDRIDLGGSTIDCHVETLSMSIGDRVCVLSLLQCLHQE